ncbi:hypothetical protein GCM10025867_00810 [Frondihabitans sucicola]|uniref:Uncharacterized protein n=1 Tax=Frondihabitans sucicola TaxID=1268041 RepID=A0ABM8GHI9_9MICO|nr:hypothetical protein GCM10025867_00810 [Frondihabitans sucicola]
MGENTPGRSGGERRVVGGRTAGDQKLGDQGDEGGLLRGSALAYGGRRRGNDGETVARLPVGLERRNDEVDRAAHRWPERLVGGHRRQSLGHPFGEAPLAVEKHFAFVGEVPEVGALGHARPSGDLRRGHGIEAALGEEFEGRLLQALACFLPASRHASSVAHVVTATVATW